MYSQHLDEHNLESPEDHGEIGGRVLIGREAVKDMLKELDLSTRQLNQPDSASGVRLLDEHFGAILDQVSSKNLVRIFFLRLIPYFYIKGKPVCLFCFVCLFVYLLVCLFVCLSNVLILMSSLTVSKIRK